MIPEAELAWVAGFVDGEGYIGIRKDHRKDMVHSSYFIALDVANTNPEVITFLRDLFGGRVQEDKKTDKHRKPIYRWRAESNKAKHILQNLLPYLRIKHKQAEVALQLAERIAFPYPHSPLPRAEINEREKLYQKMKVLNKTGQAGLEVGFQTGLVTERAKKPKML